MRLFTVFLLILSSSVLAQDVINFKDGSSVEAKISEIGEKLIIYQRWDNLEGPIFKVNKKKVVDIVFQNGSTWVSDAPKSITESFADHREKVKQLELVRDSMKHHIVGFELAAPESGMLEDYFAYVHGGIFHEFQNRKKRFAFRTGVFYSIQLGPMRLVPRNKGWIGLSLSPRYFLKNWASSQCFVGISLELGTHLRYKEGIWFDYNDPQNKYTESNPWYSIVSGYFITVGGHVTSKSGFNISIEGVVGLRYLAYKSKYKENPEPNLNPISGTFEFDLQPTIGLRLGFGGRMKK